MDLYGISTPLSSWNPLWANVHIWVQMFVDAWRTDSRREKFTIWFSRTGWRPEDVKEKYPLKKSDLQNFEKYDPQVPAGVLVAVSIQFILIAALDISFAWQSLEIPYLMKLAYVGLLLMTLLVLGAVTGKSGSVLKLEAMRCVAILGGLASAYLAGLISVQVWLTGMVYLLLSATVTFWCAKSLADSDDSTDERMVTV